MVMPSLVVLVRAIAIVSTHVVLNWRLPFVPSLPLRLHICPPLPDKVERAHSVAFVWDGRSYHGVVRDQGKCGDGGLNLLLELQ